MQSIFIYKPNFQSDKEIDILRNKLDSLSFKKGECSREQLWFQKDKRYFCENWYKKYDRWRSEKVYPDFLLALEKKIGIVLESYPNIYHPQLNSCLINKYNSGNDYIKHHQDSSYSFGDFPTIVNLSIGTPRHIELKENSTGKISKQVLESGSLFIMAGTSQKEFTHSIPKCDNCNNVRYSLTFREYKI
jgi:alkylated DNA repair dioxygenase AlkB